MALVYVVLVSTMDYFGISICLLTVLVGIQADFYPGKMNPAGAYSGPGYYWRDFAGSIPDDAFPTGNPNYFIGQLITSRTLVPALIKKQGQEITAEFAWFGHPYTQKKNFQILCTTDASQFLWKTTNVDDIHDLMFDTKFVIGGHDDGLPTLIGRALDSRKIGKVSTYPSWPGLMYVKDGEGVRDYKYDVLIYKD